MPAVNTAKCNFNYFLIFFLIPSWQTPFSVLKWRKLNKPLKPVIKRSNRCKALKESRRRCDFGSCGSGEWTYEGNPNRLFGVGATGATVTSQTYAVRWVRKVICEFGWYRRKFPVPCFYGTGFYFLGVILWKCYQSDGGASFKSENQIYLNLKR